MVKHIDDNFSAQHYEKNISWSKRCSKSGEAPFLDMVTQTW